ncbi:MAG: GNAT family N-acetyltransferase [Armatimonadota bacterium]
MCAIARRQRDEPVFRELNWRTDREAVLEFQRETYELNFPGFKVGPSFLREYAAAIREGQRRGEGLFVLEKDGRVCGFLWVCLMSTMVSPCVGYIKNLYVDPEHRGRGYGRLLVQKADEWFKAQGVASAQLTASTCNPAAMRLYEKMGYRPIRVEMEKRYR